MLFVKEIYKNLLLFFCEELKLLQLKLTANEKKI